jgi:hypothetical protein
VAVFAALIAPNLPHLAPRAYRDLDVRMWTPAYLATSGFETTTSGEFMPRWMRTLPSYYPARPRLVAGDASIREDAQTPFSWSGGAQARGNATLEFDFAYFPGWQVWVDGRRVDPAPASDTGLMQIAVASGEHSIAVEWSRTAPRWIGEGLSLLAFLACAYISVRGSTSTTKAVAPHL